MRASAWLSLVVLLFVACDGGGGGGGGGTTLVQPPPPDVVEAQAMIDSRGGVIAVTDPTSPIYGATVHVPPGAVTTATMFSIREADIPEISNRLLAGPAVEILPADARFAEDVTIVLPIYDGIMESPIARVQGAWHDESDRTDAWTVIASSLNHYADPAGGIEPVVTIRTDHFTVFAPVYQASLRRQVTDGLHPGELRGEILAARPMTQATRDFTFRTPAEGEVRAWGSEGLTSSAVSFELQEGEYVVRVSAADGSDPRCVLLPVGTDAPRVMVDATSPTCDRPTVSLNASTQLVQVGEAVSVTATATAPVGDRLTYFWNRTGGMLDAAEGEMGDGETVTATWTATRIGTWDVYFTAYDQGTGLFGEGRVTIEVRGNEPPEITSVLATPRNIAQGADEGPGRESIPPMSMADPMEGLTLLTAAATDPDGDPVTFYWWHGLPGNYYDPATGAKLGRAQWSGYVTDPTTELPFTGASVLYMAPQESFLCEGFPLGMWLGLHVVASDGNAVDRSWAMVGMECLEPEPVAEDFLRCLYQSSDGRDRCNHIDASAPGAANGETDCVPVGGDWGAGRCPSGGAACVWETSEGFEFAQVYYDDADFAGGEDVCDGTRETWTSPWGG